MIYQRIAAVFAAALTAVLLTVSCAQNPLSPAADVQGTLMTAESLQNASFVSGTSGNSPVTSGVFALGNDQTLTIEGNVMRSVSTSGEVDINLPFSYSTATREMKIDHGVIRTTTGTNVFDINWLAFCVDNGSRLVLANVFKKTSGSDYSIAGTYSIAVQQVNYVSVGGTPTVLGYNVTMTYSFNKDGSMRISQTTEYMSNNVRLPDVSMNSHDGTWQYLNGKLIMTYGSGTAYVVTTNTPAWTTINGSPCLFMLENTLIRK